MNTLSNVNAMPRVLILFPAILCKLNECLGTMIIARMRLSNEHNNNKKGILIVFYKYFYFSLILPEIYLKFFLFFEKANCYQMYTFTSCKFLRLLKVRMPTKFILPSYNLSCFKGFKIYISWNGNSLYFHQVKLYNQALL